MICVHISSKTSELIIVIIIAPSVNVFLKHFHAKDPQINVYFYKLTMHFAYVQLYQQLFKELTYIQ